MLFSLIAEHIVPKIQQTETRLSELPFQPQNMLYQLCRVQMNKFVIFR